MPKFVIFYLISAILLCGLPPAVAQQNSDPGTAVTFIEANKAYNAGNFQQAAKLYETVLQHTQNGYLYYNLGNCYFKMDELGLALLNYRRAEKFIPRFESLSSNLQYARQESKDKIETKGYTQAIKKIFFWYYWFNKNELMAGFMLLNLLFFLIASIRIYRRTEFIKWLFAIIFILYFIIGSSTITRIYQERYTQEGVVTSEELPVRSGDGFNNVVLFNLHQGTEFIISENKGDWLKIELSDGKKGWIQAKAAGII
jgi:tetratricopeptide (TPR) repeat protein